MNKAMYIDRHLLSFFDRQKIDETQASYVKQLKDFGYCKIENLLSADELSFFQSDINERLHSLKFDLPCFSPALINENNLAHKKLIESFFLCTSSDLLKAGLAFDRAMIQGLNYYDVINKFKPSTLKLAITSDSMFYAKLWLNRYILQIIESYMGLRPYLTEAYIRRNFPSKYKVMNHNWHRDRNNKKFLIKMFIFFSDCNINNGPHQYVEKSHVCKSLWSKTYYSDQEVDEYSKHTNKNIVTSTVKAGTIILEDTRGLHRALVPESGFRDLGYAVFTPLILHQRRQSNLYSLSSSLFSCDNRYEESFIPPGSIDVDLDSLLFI